MEDPIGGPLNAAAKANAAMAMTQTRFLMETCFDKIGTDTKVSYKPIMIEMSLERGVLNKDAKDNLVVNTVTTKFNLPLITILPINSLGVNNVDISFEMEVKSSYSETEQETHSKESKGEGSFEAKLGWGPLSVSIKGSASYSSQDSSTHDTHYEKSNSAKYMVKVQAGQLPVPKGVNTIIEAFTQAIQPIEMPSKEQSGNSGGKDKGGGDKKKEDKDDTGL